MLDPSLLMYYYKNVYLFVPLRQRTVKHYRHLNKLLINNHSNIHGDRTQNSRRSCFVSTPTNNISVAKASTVGIGIQKSVIYQCYVMRKFAHIIDTLITQDQLFSKYKVVRRLHNIFRGRYKMTICFFLPLRKV